jgi:hypothetical protein
VNADQSGSPVIDLSFPHRWQAEILIARPLILPSRHFVYPREAEEIERGALEVLVHPDSQNSALRHSLDAKSPQGAQSSFLATCALGFRDPAVPTGLWSTPNPTELCAVSGGYAYLIDTAAPERFTMLPFRPVLEVRALPADSLLLFVGHHAILAWGKAGQAWQSEKLSSEGITITAIDAGILHGRGWELMTDKETPFVLDLKTGQRSK